MSKFKVEFTLKQHTPIIHFQSGQSGATLRATELKPKFDRFLLENVEAIDYKKNANDSKSLDYKIKIIAISSNIETIEKINPQKSKEITDPLFFGNMGDGEKKKFISSKSIKIEFFSFNNGLIEAIKNNFEAFMAQTNFGTRQSKGFGSFYLDKTKFNPKLIPYKVYSFSSSNWKSDIKLFYSFLRQGINLKNIEGKTKFYSKPAIFSYAKLKGWQWDKKSIKEEYFFADLKKQIEKHSSSDVLEYFSEKKYLLRDLFGLSSSQEWKKPYNKTIEKTDTNLDAGKPVIERFKSPITFKIIDNTIYFWANETINDILGQRFNIKAGAGNDSLNLSTPTEFNFDDFFDFTFNKLNISEHIKNDFHEVKDYKSLHRIIGNIRTSI